MSILRIQQGYLNLKLDIIGALLIYQLVCLNIKLNIF